MCKMFRFLRADEVDVRVAMARQSGVQLLVYKDARADMNILDETVGPMNWQRQHINGNANCVVEIWDADKKQWISKEDTGSESNTEAAKGLASDSFKRACTNWGIGRELYNLPFIWVKADNVALSKRGERWACDSRFAVTELEFDESGKPVKVTITADGKPVYRYGKPAPAPAPVQAAPEKAPAPSAEPAPRPARKVLGDAVKVNAAGATAEQKVWLRENLSADQQNWLTRTFGPELERLSEAGAARLIERAKEAAERAVAANA